MEYQHIRELFVGYFKSKNHTQVPSASLIPAGDNSIMFTNAGMNQFKDVFSGHDKRDYSKAVSVQRCLRAGGKHNDLENVGYTSRHHTFFEMLGNFSFGDYFKEEAIDYALDFILKEIQLPFEKLLVTVHHTDDEAFNIWKKKGFSEHKIIRCSDKDNFWSMGDVGPCGPCSEIFFDIGEHVAGGPPGSANEDGDRFKEIWNLVFMQYNTVKSGDRSLLPHPSVDTGMGLERLASVIEGVDSNFKTSFFNELKDHIRSSLHINTTIDKDADIALNVISDHLRASLFMIHDGMLPQNEGRGYVLRRIIRRALRYGYKLGVREPFMHESIDKLIQLMGSSYSELESSKALVKKTLKAEQEQFFHTLDSGMKYLTSHLESSSQGLSGDVLFKLYDTYGFPLDIATDIAKELSLSIDTQGYEHCMAQQRERSRQLSGAKFKSAFDPKDMPSKPTEFLREVSQVKAATLLSIIPTDNEDSCYLIFDKTPFYAESGGQVGDTGQLCLNGVDTQVVDTIKSHGHHLHLVTSTPKAFSIGDSADLTINLQRRLCIARHHTATHLLHAALREVLGEHVSQKGSLVNEHRLRFDFSHGQPLTSAQIHAIEKRVNEKVLENTPVITEELAYQEALDRGALAFFDDKYGANVRMLTVGGKFSIELCGGTHVSSLGDIGMIIITDQESVASGVRRVQAVAGSKALELQLIQRQERERLSEKLQCSQKEMVDSVEALIAHHEQLKLNQKSLLWELCQTKVKSQAASLIEKTNISFVLCDLGSQFSSLLKKTADINKSLVRTITAVIVFDKEKTTLLMSLSQDLKKEVSLKKVIKSLQEHYPLKGGGRDDMVQAGAALSKEQYQNLKKSLQGLIVKALEI